MSRSVYIQRITLNTTDSVYSVQMSPDYDATGSLLHEGGVVNTGYCPSRVQPASEILGNQAVVGYNYDPLGRLSGKQLNSGNVIGYQYNLRGQLTNLSHPVFSQTLFYENGPNPCYNGNISAIRLQYSDDPVIDRAYSYDNLNRLTALTSSDGYNTAYTYNLNSSPLTIQRYGMLSDRSIGLVDDLELSYSGNRPLSVTDYAQPVLLESSLDFDAGDDGEALYGYDADGRLISDTGRGITSISYTPSNLPVRTTVKGGTFDCSYSADGRKLKTVTDYLANVAVARPGLEVPKDSITIPGDSPGLGFVKDSIIDPGDIIGPRPTLKGTPEERYYIGPFELVKPSYNGLTLRAPKPGLARINMNWGYFDSEGNNNEYVPDYQGNIRAVTRGNEIVQMTDYYPYGLPMPNSIGAAANRYKYTGKEFETRAGLNTYDFQARQYGPQFPFFSTTDSRAWDYHNLNPFLFCAANPILNIDPTGMIIEEACMDTWEEFKEEIRMQKEHYINEYNKYEKLLEKTSDKKEFYALMSSFKAIYKSLETTLNSMKSLEDSQQVYTLNKAKENIGDITYDVSSDVLSINYVNTENFVHEVTHAAQFEKGEIAFIDGLPFCYDIYDELKAYKAQDAFRGEKPNDRKVDSINDAIYLNQSIGKSPLNINSKFKDFQKAFPGKDILLRFKRAKDIPGIKYVH